MDTFSQKNKPTEPAQAQETSSKMADVLAESKREEELNNSKATIDRIAAAAEEQSKYESENMDHVDESSSSTHGNGSVYDTLDRSGLDRLVDVAMEESKEMVEKMGYKMPDFNNQTPKSSGNQENVCPESNCKY